MRRQTRIAIAVLMVVVGGLWCVQGLGWLSGSEMTGHAVWAIIGAAVLLGGLVSGVRAARGEGPTPSWATAPAPEATDAGGSRAGTRAPDQQPDPPARPPSSDREAR